MINGWIDKRKYKSLFYTWKRYFVTVELQKLKYFSDRNFLNQKGVIDFR